MKTYWFSVRLLSLILVLVLTGTLVPAQADAAATFIDIPGPPGSGMFGNSVTVLSNGNFVVTDPSYNAGRGAVYLYGPDRTQISRLTGDLVNNGVGSGGITVLTNGNYVVRSPNWSSALAYNYYLGAVTWCSGLTGCNGTLSASNSLVGSTANDDVGGDGLIALTNGNYVVRSPGWDNGSVVNAGAVTWGNGMGGTTGVVSAANSLVGSTLNDQVGNDFYGGVTALTNGNYLVRNSVWNNGSVVDAGAVTWGNGTSGTTGVVSAANSLVGSTADDQVGGNPHSKIFELVNGNYVVYSYEWGPDATHPRAGAVTWGSGTTGVTGPISASNSLVGASASAPAANIYLDNRGVTALANGNYVVSSPYWSSDGTASYWGAVTWGSGAVGVAGQISASNSLVGSHSLDYVGTEVIALTNGNYVVSSPDWDLDGTHSNVGAVTWGNGSSGITGPVSASNSLVSHSRVLVGSGGVIALANGNYVVSSPAWYDETQGPINVGAVTWGNGTTGVSGMVSTTNSLVGGSTYDSVGDGGLIALTNGNYVVHSPHWDNGSVVDAGAVTWVDGSHVTTGVISISNSLVGSTAFDSVGGGPWGGVTALTNGSYVVRSPHWTNGSITDAGAVTWGNGTSGIAGVVSASNSLVGSSAGDQVGNDTLGGVTALTNGNYLVRVPQWDNGTITDAGAVTWGNGTSGTAGVISASNSLVGSSADDQVGMESLDDYGVTALTNGNYVVRNPQWDNGNIVDAGAVTLGDGTSGTTGVVSASNSLVGSQANDQVGYSTLNAFPDGNASMLSQDWNNGDIAYAGAVSLIAGYPCITVGPVSTANSVLGTAANFGYRMVSSYDAVNAQLIVGRPGDNRVTILRCQAGHSYWLHLPVVIK